MSQVFHEGSPPGPERPFDLDANDESLPVLRDGLRQYGDVFRVRTQSRAADSLVIHDPDDIRRVLVANRMNYMKGVGLERIRVLLGNGLIVSEGEFWQRQRSMIQPSFHSRIVRQFTDLILHHNRRHFERWEANADSGEPVNLTREMSEVTLAIILRALFSVDLDRLIAKLGGNPFDLLTKASERDLAFASRFRALTRHIREMIDARRRENRTEMDFLSMLMEARDRQTGEPMSDRALMDEITSLIVAGHETTASVLNWTWYLVSQHPEVEQQLHAVVDRVGDTEQLTVERAMAVPYLEQILNEAMRLYPPVWLFGRRAIADDLLGSYRVRAGTDIFICPYLLHRHPGHWEHPDEFRPQRFELDASKERHRFTFIPFSAGPRHCVGEGLAMAEMAIHVILLARRFRLEFCGGAPPELEFQINLRAREDLRMRVSRRC